MKTVLVILIAVICSISSSFAQFDNGTICVGGIIDYQSISGETNNAGIKTDNPKTTVLGFIPRGMYYLSKNLAVGLGIGITNTKTTTVSPGFSESETKTQLTSFLPGARYMIVAGQRAGIGMEGVIDIGFGKTETTTDFFGPPPVTTTSETDISTFGVAVAPYFYLFVTERLALESTFGHIGYGSIKTESGTGPAKTETTNNAFSLNLNPVNTLTFGVAWYFGKSE